MKVIILIMVSMAVVFSAEITTSCREICRNTDDYNATSPLSCYGGNCMWKKVGYNKWVVPLGKDGQPLIVNTAIDIKCVSNFDMMAGTYDISLDIKLTWKDHGLLVCRCRDPVDRKRTKLSRDMEQELWVPDLRIHHAASVMKEEGLAKQSGTHFIHHPSHTEVFIILRLTATIYCPYETKYYPFDRNICGFFFGSDFDPTSRFKFELARIRKVTEFGANAIHDVANIQDSFEVLIDPPGQFGEHGEYRITGFWIPVETKSFVITFQYALILTVLLTMTTLSLHLPRDTQLGVISVAILGNLTIYMAIYQTLPRPHNGLTILLTYTLIMTILCLLPYIYWYVCLVMQCRCRAAMFTIFNVLLTVALHFTVFYFVHSVDKCVTDGISESLQTNLEIKMECFHNSHLLKDFL